MLAFAMLLFVKEDGTVWGAGKISSGELGNGTLFHGLVNTPVQMIGINNAVRAVAVEF